VPPPPVVRRPPRPPTEGEAESQRETRRGLIYEEVESERREGSVDTALLLWRSAIDRFHSASGHYPEGLHQLETPAGLPTGSSTGPDGTPLDPWNRPLIYRVPGELSGNDYDLYSMGPNGLDEGGGGDDILP
jgi:hypothetical protein